MNNSNTVRIGTRGSKLALWQANYVADEIQKAGLQTEIITIETKGDKNLAQPFSEIGTKGIFTEEIEKQLENGLIDIAVHSAKDMQSTLNHGLELIAFTLREEACDVLVSNNPAVTLHNPEKKYLIGTSSARRRAMLQAFCPHILLAEARGNLQTRIRKMEEGQFEGIILAYAGIHRMEYDHLIREKLPVQQFIPAVGQGSIAIEAASTLDVKKRKIIIETLNHSDTSFSLICERAFLRTLEGGCSIPIFGYATIDKETVTLNAGIASHNGAMMVTDSICGDKRNGEHLGVQLAAKILSKGGEKILNELKIRS